MKQILLALSLLICFGSLTLAQDEPDAHTKRLLNQAAKNGRSIPTEDTVSSSVHVEAVLIPRVDAKRIFGKEISQNYAVIQVIVGNKSPTAALIIHAVFIDYRDWPLSGAPPSAFVIEGRTDKYQAASVTSQVASEEYRVVRGQLLDAQSDTPRNRFLRYLTLAGNLAGAFTFSLNEEGIIKGIAAATGVGIPGLATAWPDRTVEQLNRVSDLGFRANKLVPKESSEIIVCFFPIDRFLTPGFRKLFLRSPALFFAPLQMLADRDVESLARSAVGDFLSSTGISFEQLRQGLPCYMKITHPDRERIGFDVCLSQMGLERHKDLATEREQLRPIVIRDQQGREVKDAYGKPQVDKNFYTFMALDFLGNVSLNRVLVTVDGTMAVDVKEIPPRIDDIVMDTVADCGDASSECFWKVVSAAGGVRTGVIHGAYLTGAELDIAEAEKLGITDIKKIDKGSTDDEFHFSFKLNMPVDNQTKLHFVLTKPSGTAGAKDLESNEWEVVAGFFPTAPTITSVTVDDNEAPTKITVKGNRFTATPLAVSLVPQAGKSVAVDAKAVTETSFEVTLPKDKLHPGCWRVQVKAAGLASNQSPWFAIPLDDAHAPALDSAERTDKFIFVTGKNLINFSSCGTQPFKFQMVKTDDTQPTDLKVKDWNNGSPILELPEKAKDGDWKVQVFMGQVISEKPLTVRP